MIDSIDAYLVGLEFSEKELKSMPYRGFLYSGIVLMSALCLTFLGLMVADLS